MIRKWILPIIALVGIAIAIFMIFFATKKEVVPKPAAFPAQVPFENFVAGVGMIEAASENIRIGVAFPDLIAKVNVQAGDVVKKGKILFELDTRQFRAELNRTIHEEKRALSVYEDKKKQFSFYQRLLDKRAVSEEKYYQMYFAMIEAEKELEVKRAEINEIETRIERSFIVAPIDGICLQVNAKVGQFANVNPFDKKPLILFGSIEYLHVRVDIDEIESWKIKKGRKAIAFVRGNSDIKIPLEFIRIEPYIVPKKSLTSEDEEIVDTRVLQVLYKFKKRDLPVFIGQLLDVYIQVKKF